MKILRYPESLSMQAPIFLGGTTAKGDWQEKVAEYMSDTHAVLVNTCRPDWNNAILTPEDITAHATWEFDWLDRSAILFIYIPKDTTSPTVLLELGMALGLVSWMEKVIVCIEDGYSHKLNADAACNVAAVPVYDNLYDAMKKLKDLFLTSR